ncbi:unnamed protein product [Caenorhabditis angaria]|uniref:Saposin B-type domain-containing protein n=1 Tax=Caenorhabditis angaria TaxID=860376 RepID=A0A9P1I8Z8_9PELO|nr:unnamed protein product [Caenorhabditis angaria]
MLFFFKILVFSALLILLATCRRIEDFSGIGCAYCKAIIFRRSGVASLRNQMYELCKRKYPASGVSNPRQQNCRKSAAKQLEKAEKEMMNGSRNAEKVCRVAGVCLSSSRAVFPTPPTRPRG